MPLHIALVHKEKTSAFGVQFPDVPGCFSAADDVDDLVGNAMAALSLWGEDQPLPKARSIDALKKDKTITRELAEGAFLLAVPFVRYDTRVVSANISLERGVLKAIDSEAKRRKLTRSAFLAQAAKREMER